MSNRLKRDTNTITVAEFWEGYLLDKYDFDPRYQRKSIWSSEKKSFFIDSILKNYPIPPVFLRQIINDDTGKTKYEIIDGKQRLTSIIAFLENQIPTSEETGDSPFQDEALSGKYFKDLVPPKLDAYKKSLWRYSIPIEYVDTVDDAIIDNIFDRLNRNGEPLTGQELRNAKYHDTPLLTIIKQFSYMDFWKQRLEHIDVKRMEDTEFISELLFYLIESNVLSATPALLDGLYEENKDNPNLAKYEENFLQVTRFMNELDLQYNEHSIKGVSHLYGLWCLSNHCVANDIQPNEIKDRLNAFYVELRGVNELSNVVLEYKKSMSSRTKDKGQRLKRVNALCDYLDIPKLDS